MRRIACLIVLTFSLVTINHRSAHAHTFFNDSLLNVVYHYLDTYQYDEAERIISEAYKSKKQMTPLEEYYLLCFEAEVMYYNALFGIGTESTLDALRIAESLNNDTLIGNCYNFLGLFAMNESNTQDAIGYLRKAVYFLPAYHHNYSIALQYQAYANLAECFLKNNQPDSAIYYSNLSQIEASAINRKRGMALNQLNIGDAYFLKGATNVAIKKYEEAIQLIELDHQIDVLQTLYTALMTCYHANGNQRMAMNYLNLALQTDTNKAVTAYSRIYFYKQAIAIQQKNKNYQSAFELQNRFNEIKQQNEKKEIERRNKILERYYEKSKLLALANLDGELKENELQRKNLITYFLIALVIFCLLLSISIYYLFRQRSNMQKAEHHAELDRLTLQKELEQQKLKSDVILEERDRIAKELHDDLGSLSSSIHIMSGLLENKLNQDSRENMLAQKISRNAKQLSETLSDLVWAVYSKNDSFDNLIERMKNHAFEMLQYQDIEIHFKYNDQLRDIDVGIVLRKNLFLLFKEAINNVAKYSKASIVNIELNRSENKLILAIIDNGTGFDTTTQPSGNGLSNMKSRAEAISGNLSIESAPGNGTCIMLTCLT